MENKKNYMIVTEDIGGRVVVTFGVGGRDNYNSRKELAERYSNQLILSKYNLDECSVDDVRNIESLHNKSVSSVLGPLENIVSKFRAKGGVQ